MTQPSLFVSGRTPRARHASFKGAVKAARTRGPKTRAYLRILYVRGALTDHAAHAQLQALGFTVAFSSIQSIRANLMDAKLVADSGTTAPSPFANEVTCWTLTAAGRAAVTQMTTEVA
jgi:hypothetical protein